MKPTYEQLEQQLAESQSKLETIVAENAGLKDSVEHAAGCIAAAESEGLIDALTETTDERLAGLVHRRLCHAYLEVKTPATDAVLAEVRASGVDLVCDYHKSRCEALHDVDRNGSQRHGAALCDAIDIASKLRQGGAA